MVTIDPRELDVDRIEADKAARNLTISLLIPARGPEAAAALGDIIASNRRMWMDERRVIDEIGVVIDPDSAGCTYGMRGIAREAGATWAVFGDEVLSRHAPRDNPGSGGKAGAMRSLAFLASGSRLLFHDADLLDYDPMTVGLLAASTTAGHAPLFVNGSSPRLTGSGSPGGRTTEMLRSLLSKQLAHHVPGITEIVQPLIGEFVVDADLFARMPFSKGYGVETSLKVLALDALSPKGFAQVELPAKYQAGQDYLDLVKQFHEIGFTVDVLERFFDLRAQGSPASPAEIAANYCQHFPERSLELQRPEGYDAAPFEPRTRFYPPLKTVPAYNERMEEASVRRWYALEELRQEVKVAAHG